ncbi:hypothetical protein JXA88_18215 [Candidatus Fermentibacteria bacterium]|nr:hypothetical protein [Candidatus Fermentibacteria bacterium]
MLPYIAAGFGFGLLLYPWFSPAQGILTLSQEIARQFVLLLITLFIAANVKEMPKQKRLPLWVAPLVVVALAVLLRHTVLAHLPFVPGDEDEYLFQARIFARGRISAPAPPGAASFWAPGLLIHKGRWFGHHQPGHSLLLAAGVLLGAPGLVPALSSGLTVLLLSLTAQKIGGRDAGILTGLLALSSPMLLMTGATLVSETTSLLLVVAVIWLLIAQPCGDRRSPLWAGLVLGALLNVRIITGMGALLAALLLVGRGYRRLIPGIAVGLAALVLHNTMTTGAPLMLPFQLYEPQAMGFKGNFGPAKAVAHLVRNVILLNFWLLGWPLSLILVRRGCRERGRVAWAGVVFVAWIALATAFYWHPGQVATGPLRFHETLAFLLLFSGLGWHHVAASGSFLARYVPIAMAAAHLGFMPVRQAVLETFITRVHEPRQALAQLVLDEHVVVLAGAGDLFHYPVNDPWLRAQSQPVFMRGGPHLEDAPFRNRSHLWLTQRCDSTGCPWRLTAAPPVPAPSVPLRHVLVQ